MENFIPLKPEYLSTDWLAMVINHYREKKELSPIRSSGDITAVQSSQITSLSLYSSSYHITVSFNCFTSMGSEEFTYNLFVKMASEDRHFHEIAKEARLMEREVGIYMKMMPRLRMVLNMEADASLLPLSDVIYGAYQSGGDGILVAMDVYKQNFFPLNFSDQPSLTSLIKIVEHLGLFHAASAAFLKKTGNKEIEREYSQISGSFYDSNGIFNQTMSQLQEFSQLIKRVPGFYEQYLQFEEWKSDAWDALTFRDEKSCFQCVIHGNFSADDLMVNDDRMILTSMSRCTVSSPMSDLTTLFLSSCHAKMRYDNSTKLLESYYFSLCENLKRHGMDPGSDFKTLNLKSLKEEYERWKFPAFVKCCIMMENQIRYLQEQFTKSDGEERTALGVKLRSVGRRAMNLVDEAFLSQWKQASSCQVESSSLTIKIPSEISL